MLKELIAFILVLILIFLILDIIRLVDIALRYCTPICYSLSVKEFIENTSDIAVTPNDGNVTSSYFGGVTPLYDIYGQPIGNCSATFYTFNTGDGYYTIIQNNIATDDGLILTWTTPTKLANLEADSVFNGMVTECLVKCTTKIGRSDKYYGRNYNMIVSSDSGKIVFSLREIPQRI